MWKIKYSNVHLFAVLLYDLGRFHPDFSVAVLDDVLENVRTGMEINNFKYNQQRVATVKYLGELYNYRVVDSRVIFDTLWSLVTFGHRKCFLPDLKSVPSLTGAVFLQRRDDLTLTSRPRSMLRTTTSVSASFVPCSTPAGPALTEAR